MDPHPRKRSPQRRKQVQDHFEVVSSSPIKARKSNQPAPNCGAYFFQHALEGESGKPDAKDEDEERKDTSELVTRADELVLLREEDIFLESRDASGECTSNSDMSCEEEDETAELAQTEHLKEEMDEMSASSYSQHDTTLTMSSSYQDQQVRSMNISKDL